MTAALSRGHRVRRARGGQSERAGENEKERPSPGETDTEPAQIWCVSRGLPRGRE